MLFSQRVDENPGNSPIRESAPTSEVSVSAADVVSLREQLREALDIIQLLTSGSVQQK
jgi:hypothetical protein